MFIVSTYSTAVLFTLVTMLCWGSWANTQKMADKNWRFELFYWDYVLGILIMSLIFGFTLGSIGDFGRSFVNDLAQANFSSIISAICGGIVFNLANILVVAAIAVAGMSVAFPVGIGLALVLGVLINFFFNQQGNPFWLFTGVFLVVLAIILDAIAYKKLAGITKSIPSKGILLALSGGILMSLFYYLVARSMSMQFMNPEAGMLTPYSAVFIFSIGILASNFLFNTFIMKRPVEGQPVTYKDYFAGKIKYHLIGFLTSDI